MLVRSTVIAAGNCVQGDSALFQEKATAPEAIDACLRCPELVPCKSALANVVMRLAVCEDSAVVGGEYVQWRVERPIKPYETPALLPDDGPEALSLLRQESVGESSAGVLIPKALRSAFTALVKGYVAYDQQNLNKYMGDMFDRGWHLLGHALLRYRLEERATILDDHKKIFAIADCYLKDIVQLGVMGLPAKRLPGLAIRHAPEYFIELFRKYRDHPDVTTSRICKLAADHDTNYPELAVEDYLLRLEFFRNQYKEVPNVALRSLCLASNLAVCEKNIEEWTITYRELRADPAYKGYDIWLLQLAALATPQARKKAVQGWNALFRVRPTFLYLDDTTALRGGKHERAAGAPYMDPEAYVLRQEALTNIISRLVRLSQQEQDAVILIYGLELLLDRESPDEASLMSTLNTSDLNGYVKDVILPKLRDPDD
jgi:hypothetical protein